MINMLTRKGSMFGNTVPPQSAEHERGIPVNVPNSKNGQTSQFMTRISNRIDDMVRELHSIKEVVCEELIPLQIAEQAQQLDRVPKVDELYEKIRGIITREKFRELARSLLNQLSERADLRVRHDSGCPKGSEPLVKPAVNGSVLPASATIEPSSAFPEEAPEIGVARLAGLLS